MPTRTAPLNWRHLAARAATLGERLAGGVHVASGKTADPAVADARLTRWREVAARGDATRFIRVLDAHGLTDEAAARRLLGASVRLPPGAPLPGWARLARQFTRREPVRLARAALRRRVGPAVYDGLSRRAHAALERHLAARLDEAAAGARDVERQVRYAPAGSDAAPGPLAGEQIPWAELFPHYSVLARIAAGLVRDWITAHAEFLRRLRRDRSRLAAAFFPGTVDLGPVVRLEAGAGDSHRGGRSVLLLRFAGRDGPAPRRLVYKPRDVRPEQTWADLVDGVNTAGFRPALRAGRVLARGRGTGGAYGWMEWVAPVPRRGRAERARYGRRAGALLCLFHVGGGTDGHRENVVAAGEHPVLVDVETLAHPSPPAFPGRTAVVETLTSSVLRAFLVPVPAAFRPPPNDPTAPALWAPPAGFERRTHRGQDRPPPDRPHLDVPGREFLAGFRAMARFLATPAGRRERTRARRALSGQTVRRVWLATAFYDELRRRSGSARCLRDGADRGIELEWLRRVENTPRTPADVNAEAYALERLDIPYFAARATLPDDAPWLGADGASLTSHLAEQAALLARVLAATSRKPR